MFYGRILIIFPRHMFRMSMTAAIQSMSMGVQWQELKKQMDNK